MVDRIQAGIHLNNRPKIAENKFATKITSFNLRQFGLF